MVILMVYDVIDKICKNAKMNHEPFYNSVELRGDLILLFRDKLVKESETKKSLMYEKYIEWKETKETRNNEMIEEIDGVIARLRDYYKEKLIVFYKTAEIRV